VQQLPLDFESSVTQRTRREAFRQLTDQPTLFAAPILDVDISLHSPWEGLATMRGDVDAAHRWLERVVGPVEQLRGRRFLFPASALDRLLFVRPPTKVTLDAASLTVGRALWTRKLGYKPLLVRRHRQRLLASSPTGAERWPQGLEVRDAPWTAIATLAHLGVPLDVQDAAAAALLAEKVGQTGAHIAEAGIAGSTIYISTTQPGVLEGLGLPALAYAGPVGSGSYRLPVLAAEPLLHETAIHLAPDARAAIKRLTGNPKPLEVPEPFPWTLYPFQARDAATGIRILEASGGVLFAGEMGSGKQLATSANVLTPRGKRRIGELQVGDEVLGSDGKPHRVTGVYPQGVRDMYRMHFTDGTYLDSGAEHLWSVHSAVQKDRGHPGLIKSTAELMAEPLRDSAGNLRRYIPLITAPLEMDIGLPRPVPPYTLGALLGDGSILDSTPELCDAEGTVAAEIAAELEAFGFHGLVLARYDHKSYSIKDTQQRPNRLSEALKEIGVHGHRAWEKFVPDAYKYGPADVRIAVLQGLLDTDGSQCDTRSRCSIEFCSTSHQLMLDVQWLVESLGGTARIAKPRRTTFSHKGEKREGRTSWRMSIQLPPWVTNPFRMERKRNLYQPRTKYHPTRGITAIEPAGQEEAVCISVDSPDKLYVTEHAIVTHNTTISLAVAHTLDIWPLLVAAPLSAFSTWARQLGEMGRTFYLASEPTKVAWQKLADEPLPDAVVISYDRLHAFVELLETLGFKGIIADELQKTSSPGSRRSRALRHLAQSLPLRIGLSGTPMSNYLTDLLPLGSFLVPGEWRPRATSKDLSDVYAGDPVEAVADHLGAMMVRRRMDDIGVTLPDKNVRRVYVQLTPEQRRALEALQQESEQEVAEGETDRMHVFAKLQKMRQIIACPSMAGVAGPNPKVQTAVRLAEEFAAMGKKSVLFCADRQTWKELGDGCREAGLGFVGVWGSSTVPERLEAERRFHNDDSVSVFIGTIQSCAEALTLSPTGKAWITTSYVYNPATLAQAEARIYRLNQDTAVDIIYLHAQVPNGSLDDRFVEILEAKRTLISQVVDRREHVDTTQVHYSTGDLVWMLTGKRDEKLDKLEADKKAAVKREQDKKRLAKATAHKRKYRDDADVWFDDGTTASIDDEQAVLLAEAIADTDAVTEGFDDGFDDGFAEGSDPGGAGSEG
jgi:hypothetical protein